MSQEGWNSVLLNTCTDFLEATLEVGKKEHEQNISLTQYFGHVHDPATIKNDLKTAIFLHDRKLDQKGPKSALHRTHRQPFDKKLRKKKKFKNPKVLTRILGSTHKYLIVHLLTFPTIESSLYIVNTLLQNKSFALKVKFQRNASKFPMFI